MSDRNVSNLQLLKRLLTHEAWKSDFMSDYGMVFVLLLLVSLFSFLTLTEQQLNSQDAALEVVERITASQPNANVLIVAGTTNEDIVFAETAEAALKKVGATVVGVVNGVPRDANQAIRAIEADSKTIDAVATVDAVANWAVFDNFESVGSNKCITAGSTTWPIFLKLSNILNIANQTAIYAIIAIGMTMVIITAGIDLGVGSLVALAAVASAVFIRDFGGGVEATIATSIIGTLLGIGLCALVGAFVGGTVTVFELPPFIVTLGTMMMAKGLALRLAEGRSIPELPESYFWIGGERTFGVPNPVLLMIVLYVIAHIVMSRTVFGRYVYAIGGNEEAARLSGVPVKRILLIVYTICGGLAGLGGVVLASQLEAGDPKFGLMYELEVIAAVVVGGTSLMGGSGKIFGTLIGAFIIAVIKNGMNLTGVEAFNQRIVLGAVLLAAVLLDQLKRR